MEAIVLAGGFGTRLRSVISDVPKPMAAIRGRPFLVHLLRYLKTQSVSKLIIATGYKHEVIENYFGREFEGIQILYSVEDEPLGTGGAIKKALSYTNKEQVIILNGDTFFRVDLTAMLIEHVQTKADLTVALKYMKEFERYGAVIREGERITKFEEKGFRNRGYINGGIYICSRNLFREMELPERFSFEKDFMEKYVQHMTIDAFISGGYFIDIGIPEDFVRAQSEMKSDE